MIYAIDQSDGTLACIGHESTRGKTSRHFAIDPDGAVLLVANQGTDSVATFRRDAVSGALAATGHSAYVPAPVCRKVI